MVDRVGFVDALKVGGGSGADPFAARGFGGGGGGGGLFFPAEGD